MPLDFALSGKTYLVTGANSGIGRSIAFTLAAHGADVAIHYLPTSQPTNGAVHTVLGEEAAEAVTAEIRQSGRRAVALPGNLAEPNTSKSLLARAEEALACMG
jgi:NAD(P)-dependent dehydrogenase (short-subunit alcohol dehydrogenase family)